MILLAVAFNLTMNAIPTILFSHWKREDCLRLRLRIASGNKQDCVGEPVHGIKYLEANGVGRYICEVHIV